MFVLITLKVGYGGATGFIEVFARNILPHQIKERLPISIIMST